MWCPNCKNEYVAGITSCTDCGAMLTDKRMDEPSRTEAVLDSLQEDADSSDFPVTNGISPPAFVESQKKLEDIRSTAYTFTVVGCIGLIIDFLVIFGILDLQFVGYMRFMMCSVMGIVFLAFIYIGIRSFKQMKSLTFLAEEERKRTEFITSKFFETFSAAAIDSESEIHAYDLPEQIYFKRCDVTKEYILEIAPDIADTYADYLADLFYDRLFPEF